MSDNILLNLGVGGETIATDEVGGIQHELVKVEFGTDGNATMVSASDPLPITDAAAEASLASIDTKLTSPLDVTGSTVAVGASVLPTGAATSANQQTDALTDTELRATPVPVSGTITVDTSLLATVAAQTDKSQFTKLTDGSDTALITAAGEQNVIATAQPGVDIGDVTVNNASGGSAVNIQDGGNSITIDGTVALSAGAAVIGHVIADTGSTTAVTGNVTVVQATGTNLHAVIDTGSTTAVTQATGTNLHTVVDSGTITTVSTVTAVTAISNELPAGNNNIGDVDVATLPALVAGTAIIGKVGIDQTTPGTTNGVQVNAALPAGTNAIGKLAANAGVTIGAVEIAAAQTLATVSTVTAVTSITNNVNTVEVAPTTVLNGKTTVTTAGTRVVLAASTACKSVTIKALTTNTSFIYVGSITVASTNGYQLLPGDSVSLDIANLTTVNIDSAVNGEGVTYIGIN